MAVWVLHYRLHRSPKYWIRPHEFLPQRFLVEPGDPLYPRKDAWRAFEHGPRACIGQVLSMAQLRLTLVTTMRSFDFEPGYDEWDRLHPRKDVRTVHGERVYQVDEAVGHPADHYPCRVKMAKSASKPA